MHQSNYYFVGNVSLSVEETGEQRIQVNLDGESSVVEITQSRCPVEVKCPHFTVILMKIKFYFLHNSFSKL